METEDWVRNVSRKEAARERGKPSDVRHANRDFTQGSREKSGLVSAGWCRLGQKDQKGVYTCVRMNPQLA